MNRRRPWGLWYLPGRFYDLALGGILWGVRRRVAEAVKAERIYPWLDVCCGTGSQLREVGPGRAVCGLDKSFGMVRYATARAPELPFVCGDAARLPFRGGAFRTVTVSFGLHDKSAEMRRAMMSEARRVLTPGGRLLAVDFENPWSAKSRGGALFVRAIERLAGGEHYRNGREFLSRGGLRAFLQESGFAEVARYDFEAGSLSIVVSIAEDSLFRSAQSPRP